MENLCTGWGNEWSERINEWSKRWIMGRRVCEVGETKTKESRINVEKERTTFSLRCDTLKEHEE